MVDGNFIGSLGSQSSPGSQTTGTVADQLRNQVLSQLVTTIQNTFPNFIGPPATATSPGTPGQVSYDSTHFYVCVANNTWVRATLSTF